MAIAGWDGLAPAQATDRQSGSFELTNGKPASPSGSRYSVRFRNPADPGGKPYSVERIRVRLPAGAVIDTSVPRRCDATDAELIAQGESACPRRSRVGGGRLVTDTGSTSGFPPRFVRNEVDLFNDEDELIGLADATNVPPIPPFDRVVVRSPIRRQGNVTTTTTDYPAFPGQPPPDNFLAVRSLHLSGSRIVHDGRSYLTTPPTCPASGRWITTLVFAYRDGVTQTERSASPCTPAATCRGRDATVVGTRGDDRLIGTPRTDVIVARRGEDAVLGRAGRDVVCAGRGDDRVRGGRAGDRINGRRGGDDLRGNAGRDRLRGGRGRDELRGGRHRDRCRGGVGRDRRRSCEQ